MEAGEVNTSKGPWEARVDACMKWVNAQAFRAQTYFESAEGKIAIERVQKVSLAAMGVFYFFIVPFTVTVATAAVIGTVARAFAKISCDSIGNSISNIWAAIPFGVQALGVILAAHSLYVFPAAVGIALGVKVFGHYFDEYVMARLCHRAAKAVGVEGEGKERAEGETKVAHAEGETKNRKEKNTSNSPWEQRVDDWMVWIDTKTEELQGYFDSPKGKERLEQIQKASIAAMAIFYTFIVPFTVTLATAAVIGTVARVFSEFSCRKTGESISKIWATTPFGVKALGTILAAHTLYVFPAAVGIGLGVKVFGQYLNEYVLDRCLTRTSKILSSEGDGKPKPAPV